MDGVEAGLEPCPALLDACLAILRGLQPAVSGLGVSRKALVSAAISSGSLRSSLESSTLRTAAAQRNMRPKPPNRRRR